VNGVRYLDEGNGEQNAKKTDDLQNVRGQN
jgi:hypothetical protein